MDVSLSSCDYTRNSAVILAHELVTGAMDGLEMHRVLNSWPASESWLSPPHQLRKAHGHIVKRKTSFTLTCADPSGPPGLAPAIPSD
jgi:hypothetical protein